jgi:cbb3-type cytochrome oxidase subunit 3
LKHAEPGARDTAPAHPPILALSERRPLCFAPALLYNGLDSTGMGIKTMLFDGGFTFGNFIADAFTIFMFILWFYLLIVVSGDLFRRHDVSGFAKVLWVIAFVLFSYIGVFAYLLTQGRGMAERSKAQASEAREELRHIVGFSAADEIVKLDKLKMAGSITEQEYGRLRAKLVQ